MKIKNTIFYRNHNKVNKSDNMVRITIDMSILEYYRFLKRNKKELKI